MNDKEKDTPQTNDPSAQGAPPENLKGRIESLHRIPHASEAPTDEPSVKSGTEPQVLLPERLLYVQGVHQYVNEYIRFADAKAGFLFAFTSGATGFLYSKSILHPLMQASICSWTTLGWLSFLGFAALTVAGVAAFWVVKPRLQPKNDDGLIFWETVAAKLDANAYVGEVTGLTGSGMVSEVVDHTYQLSRVARYKYRWLNVSIWASGVAVVIWIVYFAILGKPS